MAGSLHSGSGETRSSPGHPSRSRGARAAGKTPGASVATQGHAIGRASNSGRRGSESDMNRSGASRSHLPVSQSTAAKSGRSKYPGKEKQAMAVTTAAVTGSTDVTANLASEMWEQVTRYEAARRRFIGRNDVNSSRSSSSGGNKAGKNWRGAFEAAEEALLHDLEADSFSSCHGGYTEGRHNAGPDPQFLDLREALLSQPSSSEPEPCPQRELHNRDRLGVGTDSQFRVGSTAGPEKSRGRIELDRLDEIQRLQRSLLMLLDELEGKRELLAHEELQRKGRKTAEGGGDGRSTDGSGEGTRRSLHEFEDWYCWNKVWRP